MRRERPKCLSSQSEKGLRLLLFLLNVGGLKKNNIGDEISPLTTARADGTSSESACENQNNPRGQGQG